MTIKRVIMDADVPCAETEPTVQHTLILIRQALPIGGRPAVGQPAPTIREWVAPQYEALAATWDVVQPPPDTVGFFFSWK